MAWLYNAGQRRVRRAPQVAYDGPGTAADGLRTSDNFDMFNGAPDRYDWKLVGKRELFIPYNNYRVATPEVKYEDILKAGHVNQDLIRYELHRVWEVEATLKAGERNIYAKRRFYVDEDSWVAVASDQYDARGQLYRAGFVYTNPAYDVPAPSAVGQSFHDFTTGSYNMTGLLGAYGVGVKFIEPLSANAWSAEALAGAGVR